MNPIKQYQLGINYIAQLPQPFKTRHIRLPEWSMVRLFKLSKQLMPPFIVMVWLLHYFFYTPLTITIIASIFAFSLPFQAVLWLGYRANMPLILNLLPLYNHLVQLMQQKKALDPQYKIATCPNFYQFMSLLSLAQKTVEEEAIFAYEEDQSS